MKKLMQLFFIILLLFLLNTSVFADDEIVYVTSKGSMYHTESCPETTIHESHKLKLKDAINKGYLPCKICNPYNMYKNNEEPEKDNSSKTWIYFFSSTVSILLVYIFINERRYRRSNSLNNKGDKKYE